MRIIISGGGTGGHIYPAIAIAGQLRALVPKCEILFVGAKGKMEMEKVPRAGYKIKGLWISGLKRSFSLSNLSFPFKLLVSSWQARSIIKKFKPDVAIGVGGYASAPLLYWASVMKVPCLIQEQNSFAGLANRHLGKRVDKICVAYQGMEKFFPKEKIVLTGNPVRQDILNLEGKRAQGAKIFKLDANKKTLLVVGGSLGSKSINESISKNMKALLDSGLQIIWQTGNNVFEEGENMSQYLQNVLLYRTTFLHDMDLAYSMADIVVSRAGALAVSEICITQKPTIFVPYPYAAEDHQTQNALALMEKNAAMLVKDSEVEKELLSKILQLAQDEALQTTFKENISALAYPNATLEIAEIALKLVQK